MKRRRCIGVFLGQPDLPFQSRLLSCVAQKAFQADCNIAVFSNMICSGGYKEYQDGEEKIMELANFDLLDAVVVLADTLQAKPDYAEMVLNRIRENFHGVKTVIDVKAEGFVDFCSDDDWMIGQLVSHLIEVHQCKDIAFMTGPAEHPHSIRRLNGYRQAMAEHGLTCDEERIFYGDFWYDEGERVVKELMASPQGMPQAIACASDTMAISVCDALKKYGIRVPEDVLITGFDCDGNGISREHMITSAIRNIDEMAERAIEYIWAQWGEETLEPLPKAERMIRTYSCGCNQYMSPIHGFMERDVSNGFFLLYNFMPEKLLSTSDIQECLWMINYYMNDIRGYHCMNLYLCENWRAMQDKQERFFSDRMLMAMEKKRDAEKNEKTYYGMDVAFPVEEMLPGLGTEEKATIYYFNALHFERHCFGYLVLGYNEDSPVHVYDNIYPAWVRHINNALESLRRLYALNELYVAAEQKAVTDIMTGMYNRNGYNLLLMDMLHGLQEKERFLIMLFDNNGLKYINDNFGHVAGDEVICKSAEIISESYYPTARLERNFRIGGDEYVKLVVGKLDEEMVEQCIETMHKRLDAINGAVDAQYPVYLAIGYALYSSEKIVSPDQIMKDVDFKMYENKQHLKEVTGFRPERS